MPRSLSRSAVGAAVFVLVLLALVSRVPVSGQSAATGFPSKNAG